MCRTSRRLRSRTRVPSPAEWSRRRWRDRRRGLTGWLLDSRKRRRREATEFRNQKPGSVFAGASSYLLRITRPRRECHSTPCGGCGERAAAHGPTVIALVTERTPWVPRTAVSRFAPLLGRRHFAGQSNRAVRHLDADVSRRCTPSTAALLQACVQRLRQRGILRRRRPQRKPCAPGRLARRVEPPGASVASEAS